MNTTKKSALITGVAGQDGMYLAELLLEKGYKVFGIMRGQHNPKLPVVQTLFPSVEIINGDMTDLSSLVNALRISDPDEVYNLAAFSAVDHSFKQPIHTANVSALGALNLLEAIRIIGYEKKVRIYQASTSEMFGGQDYNRPKNGYNESSSLHPRSPYGVAKVYAHWIMRNYRESYGMFVSCGMLFNHESPRRGYEFVTRKVTSSVARIKLGMQKELVMGNLNAKRDWGFAGDYVKGMWLMLQHNEPDDFVLATGKTHSVKDLVETAFRAIGEPDWKKYVRQDKQFMRPAEVDLLVGDPSKAKRVLGWKPEVDFEGLVTMMVKSDLELERNRKTNKRTFA